MFFFIKKTRQNFENNSWPEEVTFKLVARGKNGK